MGNEHKKLYDQEFFRLWGAENEEYTRCARGVASVIYKQYRPQSLIDFGCGSGFHAAYFAEQGARVLPLDFSPCPKEFRAPGLPEIVPLDLSRPLADKDLGRFDMALCLDVAEHLPPEKAPVLVENLTRFSDLIVFAGAPPDQGGTGHFNEQPHGYWVELFKEQDFRYCRRESGWLDKRGLLLRDVITLRWMVIQLRVYRRGARYRYPPIALPAIKPDK